VFVSNLKVQSSSGGNIILIATDSTSTKIVSVGDSSTSSIDRKVSSLRVLVAEAQTSSSTSSPNKSSGCEGKSLLCTVICWFGEPDQGVDTPKDRISCIEVLTGDSTGVLLLLRLEVPFFMLNWYKNNWLTAGKHIQINLPRIDFVDVENDIVVCSRGDHTTIRCATDDLSFQSLVGRGYCLTNYESTLWRGNLRFHALRESKQNYYDERLQLHLSSKSKFSAQVNVTQILEINLSPFNFSDPSIRRIVLRVQPVNEKSSSILFSSHTSLLTMDFFSFYQHFVYHIQCAEVYSEQSNELSFVYLVERTE